MHLLREIFVGKFLLEIFVTAGNFCYCGKFLLQPRHLRSDFFRVVHYTEKNPALVTSLPPAWKSRINSRAVPYRRILLGEGTEAGDEVKTTEERQGRSYRRRGMKRAEVLAELRGGKVLSKADLLRCRVRYFSDGLVLGSREFVERAFQEKRKWFGLKRKSGARGLPVEGAELFSLRDLKVQALE